MSKSDKKMIAITLRRSCIGHPPNHRAVIKSLGLRRLNQTVIHHDSPPIRGMVNKVPHLIEVRIL
jgi:large subunit ribosomal protein L30